MRNHLRSLRLSPHIPLSYSARELGIRPEAYDPELDADFAPLREQDLIAAGFGGAA